MAQSATPIDVDRPRLIGPLTTPPLCNHPSIEATDWFETLIQRTRKKYQGQRVLEEKAIEEQKLKREQTKDFCFGLSRWLQEIEVRFNASFGAEVLTVTVTENEDQRRVHVLAQPLRSDQRSAELQYDENGTFLSFSFTNAAGEETTQLLNLVLADGKMQAEFGSRFYTWEQFGKKLINDLLV